MIFEYNKTIPKNTNKYYDNNKWTNKSSNFTQKKSRIHVTTWDCELINRAFMKGQNIGTILINGYIKWKKEYIERKKK